MALHAVVVVAADGVPVVVIPVRVAGILVDQHVVDEVVDVEQGVKLLVHSIVGSTGHGLHHLVPCVERALGGLNVVAAVLLDLDDVIVFLLTA